MEIHFEKLKDGVEVRLKGHMSFDTMDPFRLTCLEYLSKENVVFDLRELNFVGSSGLSVFVSTVEDLAKLNNGTIKFRGMTAEFKRIFEASSLSEICLADEDLWY